jgi:hypothetical protein
VVQTQLVQDRGVNVVVAQHLLQALAELTRPDGIRPERRRRPSDGHRAGAVAPGAPESRVAELEGDDERSSSRPRP